MLKKITVFILLIFAINNVSNAQTYNQTVGNYYATLTGIDYSTVTSESYIGSGSWTNNQAKSKSQVYFKLPQLGTFKISDIDYITYNTKKTSGPTDGTNAPNFTLYFYTVPQASGNDGWYYRRLNAEPYFSKNLTDPGNTWVKWDTRTGTNQLTFYDANRAGVGLGGYNQPTLADLQAGAINWNSYFVGASSTPEDYRNLDVMIISFQTGSAWNATFKGYLDNVVIVLKNGKQITLDLEETNPTPLFVKSTYTTEAAALSDGYMLGINAFPTITSANSVIPVGGTINVAAGTYNETVTFNKALNITGTGNPTFTKAILTTKPVVASGITTATVDVQSGGSITEALALLSSGGTINVAAGTYNETVTINKPCTIIGTGNPTVTKFIYAASPISVTGFAGTSDDVVDILPGGDVDDAMDLVQPNGTINLTNSTYSSFTVDKPGVTLNGNGSVVTTASPAITVSSTGVTISNFTFTFDSADDAVDVQNGAYNVTITDCKFKNVNGAAVGNGVINRGTGIVDARNNYWNHSSGPTYSLNPSGTGTIATKANSGALLISPWWANEALTIKGAIGATLVSPANTLTGVSVQPEFKWNTTSVANTNYSLEISTLNTFPSGSNTIEVPVGVDTYTKRLDEVNKLINNTVYFWRVKTVESGVTTYSGFWSFKTIPSTLISLLFPVNGSTNVDFNNVMYSFSSVNVNSSLKYNLQWYAKTTNPTVAPTPTEWATPTDEELITDVNTLPYTIALSANIKYYWRVQVLSSTNEVVCYSTVYNFTTKKGSYIPYLSFPIGGVPVYTNEPTLYWYIGTTDLTGITFDVTISENSDLSSPLLIPLLTNLNDITAVVPVGALSPNKTYFWAVTCKFGTETQTSTPSSFKTKGSGTLTKPTLSYPTGGVSIYSLKPVLYWYLGATGEGLYYDVFIREYSANAVPTVYSDLIITSPAFTKLTSASYADLSYDLASSSFPLAANKTYQWLVVAKNVTGVPTLASQYLISNSTTFKVDASLGAGNPVASWPKGNPTLTTQTPTLYWYLSGQSDGFDKYIVRWKKDSAPSDWSSYTTLSADVNKIDLSFTFTSNLDAGGHYYWAVASANTGGTILSNWSTGDFTIASNNTLNTVVLSFPTGGFQLVNRSTTFYWYATGLSTNIHHYKLTYSRASDLSVTGTDGYGDIRTVVDNISETSYAVTNLVAGATYYWKIEAHSSGHGLLYEATANGTFVVSPTSSSSVRPLVGSPINSVELKSTAATLSWFTPVASQSQLKYDLEYGTNSNFSNAKVVSGLTDQNYKVQNLEGNKTYYWRVAAKTNSGITSGYSNVGEFKVTNNATAIEEKVELPSQYTLEQNYPNPFNPTTLITYSLPKDAFVTLSIYDMLGREVKSLVKANVSGGRHLVEWNGDDNFGNKVSTGTYVYRIKAGDFVSVKKMLLIK